MMLHSSPLNTTIKTGLRLPRLKLRQREAILFYLCISPWLIGFVLFYLGPILASLYYSLTEWDLLTAPQFIGMDNYVRLFTRDPLALKSFKVTLVYTLVYVPLDLIFGLSLSLLLNQKLRGVGIFRTVYYLPSVLSGVAYVVMWMWMFNPQHGLINTLLSYVGIQGPPLVAGSQMGFKCIDNDVAVGSGADHGDFSRWSAGYTHCIV